MRPRKSPLGNKNIIGKNVTRIRKERNMSQKELAISIQLQGLDINYSSLSKLEGQTREANDKELWAIAKVFNVPVDALYDDTDLRKV